MHLLHAEERQDSHHQKAAAGAEVADVETHREERQRERQAGNVRHTGGREVRLRGTLAKPPGDSATDPEDERAAQDEPRDHVQEGALAGVQQDLRPADAAEQADDGDGGQQIAVQVAAQRGQRGELPRPQRVRVGGVGLHRRNAHAQHRGEGDEGAAARHGVHHARDERRDDQPDVVKMGDVGQRHAVSILVAAESALQGAAS